MDYTLYILYQLLHEKSDSGMSGLDAHLKPPNDIRLEFKRFQKATLASLDSDKDIFDPASGKNGGFVRSHAASQALCMPTDSTEVVRIFVNRLDRDICSPTNGYEHPALPGLYIFPSLLSPAVQIALLDRMFHRDASNTRHKTNLHLHYDLQYPPHERLSFFDKDCTGILHTPKDPLVHKALDTSGMLRKKLRWITLGGQYNWTEKVYPDEAPPPFPADIAALIDGLFPSMKAEAAILNLYSPGDTLSLHRDVSEFCNAPLASVSLGCDGIFMAGLDAEDGEGSKYATLRLRSGDVAVMSGKSRFAWHGVPKIIPGTCPSWMADWPCKSGDEESETRFGAWRGWMSSKRINLNVRQMYAQ